MENEKRKGIAVAGSILTDVINTVSRYPASGELTQISAVARAAGGCVPNVAADLRILADEIDEIDVYACGRVSDDENGRFTVDFLKGYGVNTENIIIAPDNSTSFTQVISVAGGQRTFFTFPGASADFGFEDMNIAALKAKRVRLLHLGYFLLLEKVDNGDGLKILKRAKELGIETSIDLVTENSDRYSLILPCLPYVDYLIVNETECARLSGMGEALGNAAEAHGIAAPSAENIIAAPSVENIIAGAKKLLEMGVRKKVIVHFPQGSVCVSAAAAAGQKNAAAQGNAKGAEAAQEDAPPPENAAEPGNAAAAAGQKNAAPAEAKTTALGSRRLPAGFIKGTTGAGDAFCAGALLGIFRGLDDLGILTLATDAAAAALRGNDAVSGLCDVEAVRLLCKDLERNELCL